MKSDAEKGLLLVLHVLELPPAETVYEDRFAASSGAVTDAYRRGWDRMFAQRKEAAEA